MSAKNWNKAFGLKPRDRWDEFLTPKLEAWRNDRVRCWAISAAGVVLWWYEIPASYMLFGYALREWNGKHIVVGIWVENYDAAADDIAALLVGSGAPVLALEMKK